MKRMLGVLVLALVVGIGGGSCGSGKISQERLVGKWKSKTAVTPSGNAIGIEEFQANGICVVEKIPMNYEVTEGGKLRIYLKAFESNPQYGRNINLRITFLTSDELVIVSDSLNYTQEFSRIK